MTLLLARRRIADFGKIAGTARSDCCAGPKSDYHRQTKSNRLRRPDQTRLHLRRCCAQQLHWRRILLVEAAALALAASSGLRCPTVSGAERLWSSPDTRWLIVGEDHGTKEQPEAFFNLVCQASATRAVTVAVEQAASEQHAISAFIASDGGAAARRRFLKSPIWHGNFKDGRSSKAYFLLFRKLNGLRRAGGIRSVVAFQPGGGSDPASYERKMADELVSRSPAGTLVIALVGGVHAMRTKVTFGGPEYLPMAGNLPPSSVVTVALRGKGGEQWACRSPSDCGPAAVFQEGPIVSGLVSNRNPATPYSAVLGLDVPTTASPPEIAADPPQKSLVRQKPRGTKQDERAAGHR